MVSPLAVRRGRQSLEADARSAPDVSSALPSPVLRPLLRDRDNHAGAHGLAALADRKPLLLLHRDRRDQLNVHGRVVPRHDHLRARWQRALPGHVRGAEVKLRTVIVEERRVPAPLLLGQDIRLRLELLVRLHRPGLHRTCPRSTASLSIPRSRHPTLSPATPSSKSLRNISTPVTTDFCVSRSPTISTSSPTLILPRSMRPVTTVPRPEIENASSIGIKNGWSIGRSGSGTNVSSAS